MGLAAARRAPGSKDATAAMKRIAGDEPVAGAGGSTARVAPSEAIDTGAAQLRQNLADSEMGAAHSSQNTMRGVCGLTSDATRDVHACVVN